MRQLYTLAVKTYHLAVATAAFFGNKKAKQWIEGRRTFPSTTPDNDRWVWIHVSSLGEFEQGRPVIEAIKKQHPKTKILLSFFSPSGYEIRKGYPLADEVLYLPDDTMTNAKKWVGRHNFVAAIFVKYDFWFNYIKCLSDNNIPLYYISVTLSPKHFFFKRYGKWFAKQLKSVRHFYVQDNDTAALLKSIGIDNSTVCGDTRFDRVADIAKQAKRFEDIERFIDGRKCIVAGSTWPPDEELLANWLNQMPSDHCLIMAPHDISESHIRQIERLFKDAVFYTNIHNQSNVLVINTIGILSQLYQYATFAYVGGAFGSGLHNIQEAVTFGCPVVFGPKYGNFVEAVDLVKQGGAFSVSNQNDFNNAFGQLISNDEERKNASAICHDYVQSKLGATQVIMNDLDDELDTQTLIRQADFHRQIAE